MSQNVSYTLWSKMTAVSLSLPTRVATPCSLGALKRNQKPCSWFSTWKHSMSMLEELPNPACSAEFRGEVALVSRPGTGFSSIYINDCFPKSIVVSPKVKGLYQSVSGDSFRDASFRQWKTCVVSKYAIWCSLQNNLSNTGLLATCFGRVWGPKECIYSTDG